MTNDKAVAMLREALQEAITNAVADELDDWFVKAQAAMKATAYIAEGQAEGAATQPAGDVKPHKIFYWGNGGECTIESLLKSLDDYSKIMPVAGRAQWAMREARRYILATLINEASVKLDAHTTAWRKGVDRAASLTQQEAKTEQAAPSSEGSGEFDAWWDKQVKNNGSPIGADYRHWALKGYLAASAKPTSPDASGFLPLPEPWEYGDGNSQNKYTESQVRAYVLADRAAHAVPAKSIGTDNGRAEFESRFHQAAYSSDEYACMWAAWESAIDAIINGGK